MDQAPRLILPEPNYRDSYITLVEEFVQKSEPFVPFPLSFPYENFAALLQRLANYSQGIGIGDFVPNTTYWLIDHQNEVVAVSNMRHRLTPKLELEGGHIGYGVRPSSRGRGYGTAVLRETLKEAKKIGVEEALITCGKENISSKKIILNNGGVYHSENYDPQRQEIVERYWIAL